MTQFVHFCSQNKQIICVPFHITRQLLREIQLAGKCRQTSTFRANALRREVDKSYYKLATFRRRTFARNVEDLLILFSGSCISIRSCLVIVATCTRKNAQVVTGLPTSRQQDVFALLVTSCQQVWNNLLTTCNNLVEIISLVARLFSQVRDMLDITRLLQPCVDNLVTSLLYHGCNKAQSCNKADNAINLVTSC